LILSSETTKIGRKSADQGREVHRTGRLDTLNASGNSVAGKVISGGRREMLSTDGK
jgi:hypothetical protein